MTKHFLFVFFLTFAILLLPASTSAQNTRETPSSMNANTEVLRQQRQERLQDDVEVRSNVDTRVLQAQLAQQQATKRRCENVTRNMSNYQNRFQQGARQFSLGFRQVETNLQQVVARLSNSESVDISQLEAHLATLSSMIADFEAHQTEYQTRLQEVIETACSEDEQSWREVLQSSKTAFRQLKTEADQIRSFIQNTIRPELIQLREQLAQSDSE